MSETPPEYLLCDTSFVFHSERRRARPEHYAHWEPGLLQRIDAAVLAISVVTLAEARYGYLRARWGPARIEREERRLASFVQLPLIRTDLDHWAQLRALRQSNGIAASDNDLWIAATALSHSLTLVSCDRDHHHLAQLSALDVVYLPPTA